MTDLPAPRAAAAVGHLGRWTFAPLPLLAEGARAGPVFTLRLWRRALVGYRPDWNRAVLGDLETFRSAGSLSDLTPYLRGGVVHADVPTHDERRRQLNPTFHSRALGPVAARLAEAVDRRLPSWEFDALDWSAAVVRDMLNAAFFAGRLPPPLLRRFLAPLERPAPAPLLPRPALFRRMDTAIGGLLADPAPGTLGAALAGLPGAVEEVRVALAAGYDTTAHTLAWAVWHLAGAPRWREPDTLRAVVDETLRLYPAGWIGSRVAARDCTVTGVAVPAGRLVLYSPYLTHRDPALWPRPEVFDPGRFADGRPAWGYLPFSAGRRTCLGAHLARAMLHAALTPFTTGDLRCVAGDAEARAGITLRPVGPLRVNRVPARRPTVGRGAPAA